METDQKEQDLKLPEPLQFETGPIEEADNTTDSPLISLETPTTEAEIKIEPETKLELKNIVDENTAAMEAETKLELKQPEPAIATETKLELKEPTAVTPPNEESKLAEELDPKLAQEINNIVTTAEAEAVAEMQKDLPPPLTPEQQKAATLDAFVPQFVKDEEDKLASLSGNKNQPAKITFTDEQNTELAEAKEILADNEATMIAEGILTKEENNTFAEQLYEVQANPELSEEAKIEAQLTMVEERASQDEALIINSLDIKQDPTQSHDTNVKIAAIKKDILEEKVSPDNPDKFPNAKLVSNAAKLNTLLGVEAKQQQLQSSEIVQEPTEITEAKSKLEETSELDAMAKAIKKTYSKKIASESDIKQAIKDTKTKIYDEKRFPEHLNEKGELTPEGKEILAVTCAYDMTSEKLPETKRTTIALGIQNSVGKALSQTDNEGKNILQSVVEKDVVLASEKTDAKALIANHENAKALGNEAEATAQQPLKEPIKTREEFLGLSQQAATQISAERQPPTMVAEQQGQQKEQKPEAQKAGKVKKEMRGIMPKANTTVSKEDGSTTISSDGSSQDTHQAMDRALVANREVRGAINPDNEETLKDAQKVTAVMGSVGKNNDITTTEEHMLKSTLKNTKGTQPGLAHDMNRDIDNTQEEQKPAALSIEEVIRIKDAQDQMGMSRGKQTD
ncbi:MAG: hypothetical protein GY804_10390 [Alphaproteobacteria bacterium]|nr:hypothetical protein [Alphaproteobacteria bacterium]